MEPLAAARFDDRRDIGLVTDADRRRSAHHDADHTLRRGVDRLHIALGQAILGERVAQQKIRWRGRHERHFEALQILDGANLGAREDCITADRVIDRHHHFELPTMRIRRDHLIVGHRGGIDLAPLYGARHHRIVTEGDELYIESVALVIAVGNRAVDGTVADPRHDAQCDRSAGVRGLREDRETRDGERGQQVHSQIPHYIPLMHQILRRILQRFDTRCNKKILLLTVARHAHDAGADSERRSTVIVHLEDGAPAPVAARGPNTTRPKRPAPRATTRRLPRALERPARYTHQSRGTALESRCRPRSRRGRSRYSGHRFRRPLRKTTAHRSCRAEPDRNPLD